MRKIATLEIYETAEPKGSHYEAPMHPDDVHRIVINPSYDIMRGLRLGSQTDNPKEIAANTLSHELGHFVDYLGGGMPFKYKDSFAFMVPFQDILQGEEQAWKYAENITKINPSIKDAFLGTYKRALLK